MTQETGIRDDGRDAEFLAFRVGSQEFGLPIRAVREVIGQCRIHKLPGVDATVSGAISLRGRFLPVVSGSQRLGLGADVAQPAVIEVDGGTVRFGLAVDTVSGVIRTDGGERHESAVGDAYRGCATGVLAREEGLLVLLAPHALAAV